MRNENKILPSILILVLQAKNVKRKSFFSVLPGVKIHEMVSLKKPSS
jgi:hypothetical protein